MRFTVNRDLFKEAVTFAVQMLPARNPQPVLGGVLLEAHEESVDLSIFNFEVSARTSVAAQIAEPGRALVPGALLGQIAQKLPNAEVELFLTDGRVEVRCGSSSYNLPAMPVEEYPSVPVITEITGEVPAAAFREAVEQVSKAASTDDVTPVITSVQLSVSDNNLKMTATDRYRVAIRGIDWESHSDRSELSVLVPHGFLSGVAKQLSHAETIKIALQGEGDRELIGFVADGKTVTSQLITGNYPPVERLFPDSVDHYAVVNTQDLIDAVDRVAIVADSDAALRFSFTEGQVALEGIGSETARANESVDCHLNGPDQSVALRPKFLKEGLSGARSEFCRIGFTSGGQENRPSPVLITGQHGQDAPVENSFRYLLQPVLKVG